MKGGVKAVPYNKNKQQAFQAAQQAFVQLEDAYQQLDEQSPDYGHQTKRVHEELNEAEQIIEKAYVVATEHQKHQLDIYANELMNLKYDLLK
jgi:hypothetical protein